MKDFIWLSLHDRLMSNSLRFARHMCDDNMPERCGMEIESTEHILYECEKGQKIGDSFDLSWRKDYVSLFHGLKKNMEDKTEIDIYGCRTFKYLVFIAILWNIWKLPKRAIIDDKEASVHEALLHIRRFLCDLTCSFWMDTGGRLKKKEMQLKWIPPPAT